MNVVRPDILERGIPNKERVHLKFAMRTFLSYYTVFLNHVAANNMVASGHLSAYWFPSIEIQPGDEVLLYSCGGTPSSAPGPDGGTVYKFYWGFPQTLWHEPRNVVVLAELTGWETSFPGLISPQEPAAP